MQAAAQLIHTRGYNAVGVQDICRLADVKKGSFYYFFDSKADLVLAVLELNLEELKAQLASDKATGQPALVRLQQLVTRMRERYIGPDMATGPRVFGCPIGNLAVEVSTLDERLRRGTALVFERLEGAIADLLVEAVSEGALAPHDSRQRARELMAFVQGAAVLAKAANRPEIIDDLIERLPALTASLPSV
ncbi:MAG: TetR family transcriptional regulator [Myxococcales bacterium]|nr:TetR family transcriptional regulator [Myxococcales bacterium]